MLQAVRKGWIVRRSLRCLTLVGAMVFVSLQGYLAAGAAIQEHAGKSKPDTADFSPEEWAIIKMLSPLPALPIDTTNKYRDSPAAALLGQKLFFEPRIAGPIQTGTPKDGQLGAIGEAGKIACSNCHMPESKWLFDIRSNNGGAIPNATALGSNWMTRNVSSVVNTVFMCIRVRARTGARMTASLTLNGLTHKANPKVRRFRMAAGCNWRT